MSVFIDIYNNKYVIYALTFALAVNQRFTASGTD